MPMSLADVLILSLLSLTHLVRCMAEYEKMLNACRRRGSINRVHVVLE
jgi:hypothetical protein